VIILSEIVMAIPILLVIATLEIRPPLSTKWHRKHAEQDTLPAEEAKADDKTDAR